MRSKPALLLILSLVGALGRGTEAHADDPEAEGERTDRSPDQLTVATYNLHARRHRSTATVDTIAALDADIILLQEVSRPWLAHIRRLHQRSHPHRATHIDAKYYGGLAVLSRYPIRDASILRTKSGRFPAWRGVVDTRGGPVQLVNVHLFPPIRLIRTMGLLAGYKKSQELHVLELEEYWPHLDADLPTVIAGDFNEDRHGRGIAWLGERGFASSHRSMAPTWRWTLDDGVAVAYQLDHVVSRGFDAVDTQVVDGGGSDHLPVVTTLARNAQP